MKSLIRACRSDEHEGTVYTLGDDCPDCGSPTRNTAPPRFSPDDAYGEYRRSTKWKR